MDKRQEKIHQILKERSKEDRVIFEAMNTVQGKALLVLLRELFFDQPSFVADNMYRTAFKEGQRDVVGFLVEGSKRHKELKSFGKGVDDAKES